MSGLVDPASDTKPHRDDLSGPSKHKMRNVDKPVTSARLVLANEVLRHRHKEATHESAPLLHDCKLDDEDTDKASKGFLMKRFAKDHLEFVNDCHFAILKGKEFGLPKLRKIFHLADIDNSGGLNCLELQLALELIGLEDINPMALTMLFIEIDRDNTGGISEQEFLTFFRPHHSKESINRRLLQLDTETTGMKLHVTKVFRQDRSCIVVEEWNIAELQSKLSHVQDEDSFVWIDAVGFHEDAIQAICSHFGLAFHEVITTMLLQFPHAGTVKGPKGDIAKLILHSLELTEYPFTHTRRRGEPFRSCRQILFRSDAEVSDDCPELIADKTLVNNSKLKTCRLSVEQCTLLMLDSNTILSLRFPPRSKGYSSYGLVATPLDTALNELRQDMAAHPLHYPFLLRNKAESQPTVAALLLLLVVRVFWGYLDLSDVLTDWEDVLHEQVNYRAKAIHTQHLAELKTCAERAAMRLQILSRAISLVSLESQDKLMASHWDLKAVIAVPFTPIKELEDIFVGYISNLKGLADDMQTLAKLLNSKLSHADDLAKKVEQSKTNTTNRILYALTLLTVITIPSSFLTGLFGMNFTDMWELDPASGYGYKLFWIALGAIWILLTWLMYRFGLFSVVFDI